MKLFSSDQLGDIELTNRLVMAPIQNLRSRENHFYLPGEESYTDYPVLKDEWN